jgi:hypothetical protein
MRLIKNGCKVKFGEDVLETFAKVENPDDIVTNKEGARVPRTVKKPVWLVNIRIPKTLLDVSEDVKDTDDVDYDSVDAAYEDELDGSQGLQDENEPITSTPEQPSEEIPA